MDPKRIEELREMVSGNKSTLILMVSEKREIAMVTHNIITELLDEIERLTIEVERQKDNVIFFKDAFTQYRIAHANDQ